MKILFLHFPIDNDQIESKTLPDYFSSMGHEVYSAFEKKERNFYSIHNGIDKPITKVNKNFIKQIKFNAIICKNDSYQKYGKIFSNENCIIINITPMGIKNNYLNCNYFFNEDELIKSPVKEMQYIFDNNFIKWENRKNQIIVPASIGSDKNQKEIVDFVDKDIFKNFNFLFAGKVYSKYYKDYLENTLNKKNIKCNFKYLSREELAYEFLNSKLTMLTTDPRPSQPFDPGPRVIYESIRAGTICIINDLVKINKHCSPFCYVYQNSSKESFDKHCKIFFNNDNNDMSDRCYKNGKEYITIEYACKSAYSRIIKWIT